jgi:hypothetical protein
MLEQIVQVRMQKTMTETALLAIHEGETIDCEVDSAPHVSRIAKTTRIATAPTYTSICAKPMNCASSCKYSPARPRNASISARTQCTRLRNVSAAAAPTSVSRPRMKNGRVNSPGTSSSFGLDVASLYYLALYSSVGARPAGNPFFEQYLQDDRDNLSIPRIDTPAFPVCSTSSARGRARCKER